MKDKKYTCFEDYPQDIQEEAQKILEEGNPLEYFKKVIRQVHIGDETAIELLLLSIGSLFIKNAKPVHQQIKGSIGTGKTSLLQKTLRVVPEQYIQKLDNITPEYLHSIKYSFNSDYNIFLLDDINPTPSTTAMLRKLTDNEVENKVFIESKGTELEIPGKNLFLCTFTEENNTNKRLEHNLLINKVDETLKHNQKASRKSIKDASEGYGIHNVEVKAKYLVANTVFEKLIENPVKVFNYELNDLYDQFGLYTKYQKFNDLKNIVNLSKARAFYYQKRRWKVDNIVIGTGYDMLNMVLLFREKGLINEYNLNEKQKKLILMLFSYNDDLHEHAIRLYKENSNSFKDLKVHTYNYLAQQLDIPKDQLVKWVTGRSTGKRLGLEEIGLVKTVKINPSSLTSPAVLYLNPNATQVQSFLAKKSNAKVVKEDSSFNLAQDANTKLSMLNSFSRVDNKRKCEFENEDPNFRTVVESNFLLNKDYKMYSYKELSTYLKQYKEYIKKHCKKTYSS